MGLVDREEGAEVLLLVIPAMSYRLFQCPPCQDVKGLQGFHPKYRLPMSLPLDHPHHLTDPVRVGEGPFSTVS